MTMSNVRGFADKGVYRKEEWRMFLRAQYLEITEAELTAKTEKVWKQRLSCFMLHVI